MNRYSKIMLIGFLLLSAGGLLAQSPPNDLMNKLAKENTKDDEIRRLQRERLKAALLGVEFLRKKTESGVTDDSAFLESQKVAALAALELAETREEKIQCLKIVLEGSRKAESRVLALKKLGVKGGQAFDAARATFWRLDAEINLLTFKRDSALAKSTTESTPTKHKNEAEQHHPKAPHAKDDEIRNLQLQRLESALLGAEALDKGWRGG